MNNDSLWLSMILDRVRSELEGLCSELGILKECSLVLESLVESHPVWFEGKKKRTVVAVVLYVSLLISKGPRRGVLREALDLAGVSKVSLKDAVSKLIMVDWNFGYVYLNPRFYAALRKRTVLPRYVVPLALSEIIRVRMMKTSPGLYEFLDVYCRKNAGKDCVTALFENPVVIKEIIVSKYRVSIVAKRVAERFFAPIVDVLEMEEPPGNLAELLLSNPDELHKLLVVHASRLKQTP